jgi:anaerobic dimethyl sulfoxide reductase subunit C (anchor subunit)
MEIQWPLIIFTLCITLASGLLGGLGLLGLLKKPVSKKAARVVIIAAAAVLIVGGAASFLHLQHWDRAFNGFGHLTSGITHEMIGAVVMLILLLVAFMLLRKAEALPSWMNGIAAVFAIVFTLLLANSYYMPARPAWATFALFLYYLAQTLLLGSVGLWVILAGMKEESASVLTKWTAATAVLQLVVLAIYAGVIAGTASQFPQWGAYFDWTAPNRPATNFDLIGKLISGEAAPLFWGGAIVAGGVIPALLGFFQRKASGDAGTATIALAFVAVVCALGGGVAFRAALYLLGNTVVPF